MVIASAKSKNSKEDKFCRVVSEYEMEIGYVQRRTALGCPNVQYKGTGGHAKALSFSNGRNPTRLSNRPLSTASSESPSQAKREHEFISFVGYPRKISKSLILGNDGKQACSYP